MTFPLPLIVAGPIVRRVDAESVAVWIALSEPREETELELRIFSPGPVANPSGIATTKRVQLGAHLYIYLLQRTGLALSNEDGQIYEYDISDAGGASPSGHLLEGDDRFSLRNRYRPTFVLPRSPSAGLRIAHASCRKPHGGGKDALPVLAQVLNDTVDDTRNRPQLLLLTGDQIYADDLPASMLKLIKAQIPELFGWTEAIATDAELTAADLASDSPIRVLRIPQACDSAADRRRATFLQKVGLKEPSVHSADYHYYERHLLTLQEWCVMYLLCWSDGLWRDFDPSVSLGADGEPVEVKLSAAEASSWETLLDFRNSLSEVQRALANISTLMIFDDHDITDDWFHQFSRERMARGGESPLPVPCRIIRNGLVAYALFQDWGNQPDLSEWAQFHNRVEGSIKSAFEAPATPDHLGFLDQRNDWLGVVPKEAGKRHDWNYSYQGDGFQIAVLDTRTWRGPWGYGSAEEARVESLLPYDVLMRQIAFNDDDPPGPLTPSRPTLVVAPAPIAGSHSVDLVQHTTALLDDQMYFIERGGVRKDVEAWHICPASIRAFVGRFQSHGISPVVLSGDVHYAYSEFAGLKGARTLSEGDDVQRPGTFLQLCSSSAKNSEFLTRLLSHTDLVTSLGTGDPGVLDIVAVLGSIYRNRPQLLLSLGSEKLEEVADGLYDDVALLDALAHLRDQSGRDRLATWLEQERQALVDAGIDFANRAALLAKLNAATQTPSDSIALIREVAREVQAGWNASPLETRGLLDSRPRTERFAGAQTPSTWDLSADIAVPASVERWVESHAVLGKAAELKWLNFGSVGDTNIGLVDLTRSPDADALGLRGFEVRHLLIWTLPRTSKEMYSHAGGFPGHEGTMPTWATTLHVGRLLTADEGSA